MKKLTVNPIRLSQNLNYSQVMLGTHIKFKSQKEIKAGHKIITDDTDFKRLRQLLRDDKVTSGLDLLSDMAECTSVRAKGTDGYKLVTNPFCDGVEYCIGRVNKAVTTASKSTLMSELNSRVDELIFKHALITNRVELAYIWLTLNPETSQL